MTLVFVNNIEIAPACDFKVYRRNRSTAPFILNVDTSWNWVFNLTPRPINSREVSLVSCGNRTSGLAYHILVAILALRFQLTGL